MKENSPKDSTNYTIFKLLMNSLYGRFGMSPKMEVHKILDQSLALKYHTEDDYVVTNTDVLLNGKELISFFDINERYNNNKKINISVPIASAITSYSRIYMSKFKNMLGDNLFYSDTDSLYSSIELNDKYIDQKKLGKFKLERIFDKAIFLAPKMYGGRINSGKLMMNNNIYTGVKEYIKIKGVKIPIKFNQLLPLLYIKNSLKINQIK
jgi:DNA polymerase elongation subunit (family B)